MLADVVDLLACPVCRQAVALLGEGRRVECPGGHSFDVAKQGYVSLPSGGATKFIGDSAEMVAARSRFLGADHYARLAAALGEHAARSVSAVRTQDEDVAVLEVGAGTGHYLATVLERIAGGRADHAGVRGVGVDVSKYAARRLARIHPRVGAVVADVWSGLPVRDGAVEVALSVFAPRNGPELRRVLRPDGALIVLTPRADHLVELVNALDLVHVDSAKDERLERSLADFFEPDGRSAVEFEVRLPHAAVADLVGMGPSARHLTRGELAARISRLPSPMPVTVSANLSVYRVR